MTCRRMGLVIAALALVMAGCDPATPDQAPREGTVPAHNATEAPLLPTTADALPVMAPAAFDRLLGQLEGTPVLVNFWGSWCPPCHDEMPHLVAAHHEWGNRVQFLGVDVQDSRTAARSFIEEFGMAFPSVFDAPDAIKTHLGQLGQPTTIFFRADGSFSFSWAGPISEEDLERQLARIAG